MELLKDFFEEIKSQLDKILEIAKEHNIKIEANFDISEIPKLDFFDIVEKLRDSRANKFKARFCYSFLQNFKEVKVEVSNEDVLPRVVVSSEIELLKKEFEKGIVLKLNKFLEDFEKYKEEVNSLTLNQLNEIHNNFPYSFQTIPLTWAYLSLRKGGYNDAIIWYLFEESLLLDSNQPEILDEIMGKLRFTNLEEKIVRQRGAWGGYWKRVLSSPPRTLDDTPAIAEWYEQKGHKYHAIAIYEYWIDLESYDEKDEDVEIPIGYIKYKESFYPELARLYLEIGEIDEAEFTYKKYLRKISPDDAYQQYLIGEKLDEVAKRRGHRTIQSEVEQRLETAKKLLTPNVESYFLIYEIENKLKKFVDSVLSEADRKWWNNKDIVSFNVDDLKKRREEQKDILKIIGESLTEFKIICFATLDQIQKLIAEDNKERFMRKLGQKTFRILAGSLPLIVAIRNEIAHFRPITDSQLGKLRHEGHKVLNILNDYLSDDKK